MKSNFFIGNRLTLIGFLIVPFVGYWVLSYFLFLFGPFMTPQIGPWTHLYVGTCLLLFLFVYMAISTSAKRNHVEEVEQRVSIQLAYKTLRSTAPIYAFGALLMTVDKIFFATSLETVLYSENAREIANENITFLTTISVIPYSFKLVALASYFYLMRYVSVSRRCHAYVGFAILMELLNMVFTGNRGAVFYLLYYMLFYMFYSKGLRFSQLAIALKSYRVIAALLPVLLFAIVYFGWVADHRVQDTTAMYLGREARAALKNPSQFSWLTDEGLHGYYQLFYYLTHGFSYIDAILRHAPILNVDVISPMGIRVEAQIGRFMPGYIFPAKLQMLNWISAEGLSRFGWPTIFGASAAYFGYLGSYIFFLVLAIAAATAVKSFIGYQRLTSFLMTFLIFNMLVLSMDWVVRDFDVYVGLLFVFLMHNREIRLRKAAKNASVFKGCAVGA